MIWSRPMRAGLRAAPKPCTTAVIITPTACACNPQYHIRWAISRTYSCPPAGVDGNKAAA